MTDLFGLRPALAGLALLALAACDSAEERAEGHYQNGLELIAADEPQKAMIEFRNAINLNDTAVAPRLALAGLHLRLDNPESAVNQYLRVTELDGDNLEARLALARLFLSIAEPDEASRHVAAAARLAPEDITVRGLQAQYAYLREDPAGAEAMARAVLDDAPGDPLAALVLAEVMIDAGSTGDAVAALDIALAETEDNFDLHFARLRALEAAGDEAGVGDQLERMVAVFPDDLRLPPGLARWQVAQGDITGAEATLRHLADKVPDSPEAALDVVAFLNVHQDEAAARAELLRLTESGRHPVHFAQAMAEFDFLTGARADSIDRLRGLLDGEQVSGDVRLGVETQLATYLYADGAADDAAAIVARVLEADAANVDALVVRARAALSADRADAAISDLRKALDGRPRDPAILTALAEAHLRNGSPGLARDRLALAVQSAEGGVDESLAFAGFLKDDGDLSLAATVLEDALGAGGELPVLLADLGQVRLMAEDWPAAAAVADRLDAVSGDWPEAEGLARDIRVAAFNGQGAFDRAIALLSAAWDDGAGSLDTLDALVRAHMAAGQADAAMAVLDAAQTTGGDDPRPGLLLGAVHDFAGDGPAAEAAYQAVISAHPNDARAYGALTALYLGQGREAEADAVLASGLDAAPADPDLRFAKAGRLQAAGDMAGALALYDGLYAENQGSDVLANNLAALLADHGGDEASLERAHNIAKRLRGAKAPAFQDTYGWILVKRGSPERGLVPLQVAAEALPNNPTVLYHLGLALRDLGKTDMAVETLTQALAVGPTAATFPDRAAAEAALGALSTE